MILGEREAKFLIKNEDTLTLKKLSKIFNCTWQEVYDAYDSLTRTEGYKRYVAERTKAWMEIVGGKNEQKMESNGKSEGNKDHPKNKLSGSLVNTNSGARYAYNLWEGIS